MTGRSTDIRELSGRVGSFNQRLARIEEELANAKRMASEAQHASEEFKSVVQAHVDSQYKAIGRELNQLKQDTVSQNSTLDMQTQQLKTLDAKLQGFKTIDAKLDNVIQAVEAKQKLEMAKEQLVKTYDERIRRIAATIGLVATALGVCGWVITHWPFR
jgi:chromosome segregation ATPase